MKLTDSSVKILASRIESAVFTIGLNLDGQRVLTEAASGPYIATPVIAAFAGAEQVIACTRDSPWGCTREIFEATKKLANFFGVANRIRIHEGAALDVASDVDIVTNLGFVRPISRELVQRLPHHAAISLMWEPWEFRAEDIDLIACRENNIPIIATNEHHRYLNTFKAVGMLALKLLFEKQVEVSGLKIVVIGSDPFGASCAETLSSVGAYVTLMNPELGWGCDIAASSIAAADAVVLVEHRFKGEIFGQSHPGLVDLMAKEFTPLVHICGKVNDQYLKESGVEKFPAKSVQPGFMTITTSYLGSKPVVDLHTAGLHVGSIVAKARSNGSNLDEAIKLAVDSGYGLNL
jgi:hypothetical protein